MSDFNHTHWSWLASFEWWIRKYLSRAKFTYITRMEPYTMKVKCMFSSQFNLCNKNRNGLLKTFPQLQKLLCAFYIITKLCPQTKNYPQRSIACGTKSNTWIWGLETGLNSVIKLVSCRQVHVQKEKTHTKYGLYVHMYHHTGILKRWLRSLSLQG